MKDYNISIERTIYGWLARWKDHPGVTITATSAEQAVRQLLALLRDREVQP